MLLGTSQYQAQNISKKMLLKGKTSQYIGAASEYDCESVTIQF